MFVIPLKVGLRVGDLELFRPQSRNFLSAKSLFGPSTPHFRKAEINATASRKKLQRATTTPPQPRRPYRPPDSMETEIFVLPGDHLDPESLPSHPKLPLKLGPGLRHIPPNTITPTVAGQLCTDKRKNAVWVEFNGGRVSCINLQIESQAKIVSSTSLQSVISSLRQFKDQPSTSSTQACATSHPTRPSPNCLSKVRPRKRGHSWRPEH